MGDHILSFEFEYVYGSMLCWMNVTLFSVALTYKWIGKLKEDKKNKLVINI